MEKPALLIIDMQNDFVLEGKPLRVAGAQAAIPKMQSVLAEFRKRPLPVFHILRVHRADGSDVEIIRQERFRQQPFAVAGTPGAAVIDELTPRRGEYVVEKIRMSAFIGTELDLMLRTLGVRPRTASGQPSSMALPTITRSCSSMTQPGHPPKTCTGPMSGTCRISGCGSQKPLKYPVCWVEKKVKKLLFPDIVPDQPDTASDDDNIVDCRNDGDELVGDPGPDQLLDHEIELECCDQDKKPDDDIHQPEPVVSGLLLRGFWIVCHGDLTGGDV
jgi:hypothetical protein